MAHPSPSAERSGPRRDVLTVEVLDKAAALFARRGFAATSLQDIAKEIGLSRTSLYYYFASKEALLEELVRGVTQRTSEIFAELSATAGASHSESVAEAVRRLVLWVTDPHTHFQLLDRTESELPDELAAVHRDTKRRVLRNMVELIQNGVTDGEFKPINASLAAFAILGMCNWTAWWFSPSGNLDRKEVAAQIADFAVAMIQPPSGAGAVRDMKSLVGSIRENLRLIELMHAP